MKKIVLPIILLLGLVLAAAPYVVGIRVKSQSEELIAQINENTAYRVESVSYDSGWLSSNAELSLSMAVPGMQELPELKAVLDNLTLLMVANINHGPFLKQNGLGWAEWEVTLKEAEALRKRIEWDKETPLYKASGKLALNGDLQFSDAITMLKTPANSGMALAFGGYLGNGDVANGVFTYKGKSGSTEISSPMGTASIGPIALNLSADSDFDAIFSNGLYNTQGNILLPEIRVDGAQSFSLKGLEAKYDIRLSEAGDRADFDVGYLIDSVQARGYQVSDIAIELGMDNYSVAFHNAYMEFAKEIAYSGKPEPDPTVVQAFTNKALPLLLHAGPSFKVRNLAFTLPSGRFESNMKVQIDSVNTLPDDPANFAFWLDKISADAAISADQSLVNELGTMILAQQISQQTAANADVLTFDEQTGEMIETPQMTEEEISQAATLQLQQYLGMVQGMGMVVQDGATYKSELKYDRGNAQVNGQDFALPF